MLQRFVEYLHADSVLFGQPINHSIKCKHPIDTKDGDLIVHQNILKPYIYESTKEEERPQWIRQLSKRKESSPLQEEYHEYTNYEGPNRYKSTGKQEQEEVSDQQQNQRLKRQPFSDQFHGVPIDTQYLSHQISKLLQGRGNPTVQKYSQAPIHLRPSQQDVDEELLYEQDDDSDSWMTEEQEEEYVTNEKLEQVSGNFIAELDLN